MWHNAGLTALPPAGLASRIDVRGDFAVDECRIELHDGRAVTCIRFNVYKGGGGLSCDWDNASGKDLEQTE